MVPVEVSASVGSLRGDCSRSGPDVEALGAAGMPLCVCVITELFGPGALRLSKAGSMMGARGGEIGVL